MTTAAPSHSRTLPASAAGDGRVLGLTRAGIWVLLVLAAANGLFLYLLPQQADTRYAWPVKPPASAAFIGAGFLAGTVATGLVLATATRWRTFSTLPIALWTLASTLAVATVLHAGRFKWGYPPTWVWALVYGGVPFAVPVLVARQRRAAEPEPVADPGLRALRLLSALAGAALLAGAIALFFAPVALGRHWPWALTPLLARTVAAWYALFGTMLLSCAAGLRRRAEAIIPYATLAAWCLLLLALPPLYADDVDGAGVWIAAMVLLLALAAFGLRVALPERGRL